MPGPAPALSHYRNRILEALRLGMTYEKACRLAGVKMGTFMFWKNKAKDAKSGVYFDFWCQVQQAIVEAEEACLQVIRDAAKGGTPQKEIKEVRAANKEGTLVTVERVVTRKKTAPAWQAAAWLLERRCPEDYGKRGEGKSEGDSLENIKALLTDLAAQLRNTA